MNCGTHANSDRVMISARMILPDGTILDTGDADSRKAFLKRNRNLLKKFRTSEIWYLRNKELTERIRQNIH